MIEYIFLNTGIALDLAGVLGFIALMTMFLKEAHNG